MNTKRILIIDDDPNFRHVLSRYLTQCGYETITAADGAEGLAQARADRFHAALVDLNMPNVDGLQVIATLKAEQSELPTVVVSGTGILSDAVEAMRQGAWDYIAKPIRDIGEIVIVVERAMEKARLISERAQAEEGQRQALAQALQATRALQKARDELEQRVEERTSELAKANAELRFEIAERVQMEKTLLNHTHALRESEERFRATFEQAAVGMTLTAPDGRWLRVNQKLCDIVGYTRKELLGKTFHEITYPDDLETNLEHIRQVLAGETQTFSLEKRYIRKDDSLIWVDLTTSLVRGPSGEPKYFITVLEDVTRRKMAEEQLLYSAFYDALTGLPNRALFMDHLKRSIEHAKRQQNYLFAVLFLDLDQFKIVNDSLGYLIGDQLVLAIALRLKTSIRPGDTVAYLGEDEFAILLDDIKDAGEVKRIAGQIQKEVARPVQLDEHKVVITSSTGIALGKGDSGSLYERSEDILRDADIAMCQAKAQGRAQYVMFDNSMRAYAVARLELETDLRRAVEQQEFQVYYQPIVSVVTGQITGAEALLRWQPPNRDMVYPSEFISLLEETGLIVPVNEWLLHIACAQVKDWHAAGYTPLRLTVNISVRQLQERNLPETIIKALAATGLAATSLELEVTESIAMQTIDFSLALLNELSAAGLYISIDDFGVGYSSLGRLRRLPIHILKIDRSFIRNIASDPNDAVIVTAIIAMAHSLNLKVVAEGVETEEQLAFLRAQQCDEVQGHLFSQPVPAETLTQLLQSQEKK
ncbi:MAG: EAL domain-containing protein [Anaerolineae bacterium]